MRVRIENDPDLSRYEIYGDDKRAGFLKYRRDGNRLAIDHTEIDEDFEGEGMGTQLARYVLDEARKQGVSVLPFCPFVREWIERHPDYIDLIPAEQRGRFGFDEA